MRAKQRQMIETQKGTPASHLWPSLQQAKRRRIRKRVKERETKDWFGLMWRDFDKEGKIFEIMQGILY